jgi:lauroyl/myristoyl acyltransferase
MYLLMALASAALIEGTQPQSSDALGLRMEEYRNCVSEQIREEALRQYRKDRKLGSDKAIADFAIGSCSEFSERLRVQMAQDLTPMFPAKSPDEIDRLASDGIEDFNKTTMKTFARAFVREVPKKVIEMVEQEDRAKHAQN